MILVVGAIGLLTGIGQSGAGAWDSGTSHSAPKGQHTRSGVLGAPTGGDGATCSQPYASSLSNGALGPPPSIALALFPAVLSTSAGERHSDKRLTEVARRVPFERVVIEPVQSNNGHKPKAIGDLDGDGDADLVAWTNGEGLNWYEAPTWAKHPIHVTTAEGDEDAQTVDVDNDVDIDIVISGVQWFENPLRQGQHQPRARGRPTTSSGSIRTT